MQSTRASPSESERDRVFALVRGELMDTREAAIFTSQAFYEYSRAQKRAFEHWNHFSAAAAVAASGGVSQLLSQVATNSSANNRVLALVPAVSGFFAGAAWLAQRFGAIADERASLHADYAAKWNSIYHHGTRLRNQALSGRINYETLEERLSDLNEQVDALREHSPPTDEESYQRKAKDLNSYWYQGERNAAKSHGYDEEYVRAN